MFVIIAVVVLLIIGNFFTLIISCLQLNKVVGTCDRIYERAQAQQKVKVDSQTTHNT